MWTNARRIATAAAVGLATGIAWGHVIGFHIRSDNVPFFMALGAVIGLCIGLTIGLALDRRHAV
jgi:hypothetical protein